MQKYLSNEELLKVATWSYEHRSTQQRVLEIEAIEYMERQQRKSQQPHFYRKARKRTESELWTENSWYLGL